MSFITLVSEGASEERAPVDVTTEGQPDKEVAVTPALSSRG